MMAEEPHAPDRLLERSELFIYLTTAFLLVVAAAGLLLAAAYEMTLSVLSGHYDDALLHLLDRALLVLMLAEIIYTVRRIAHRKRLEAEPFFIVAIIAAIRRILVITAEAGSDINLSDPVFQAALAELGLLAVIIVSLAVAMRLIPSPSSDEST
jgi:uncharacterized membrane protein (DUF373 family)